MHDQSGFSPVEVLLAATIFGMITTALAGAIIFARSSTASSGDRLRATQLAEEGVEAARNIGKESFNNLADGTYGLTQSGGVWAFSGSSDANGAYTRSITISSVDASRKTITANVSWAQQVGSGSVSIDARIADWTAAMAASWLNATLAGSYDAPNPGDGIKIATQGNYAYIVRNNSPNFVIANVSNPAAPTLVTAIDVANTPTNIAVSGTHAYITSTANNAELQILDISNPASPAVNATYNATGNANGQAVAVSGNYAYLTRAANGSTDEFVVLNVATPTAPVRVGGYSNNVSMNDVTVDGNYAYVSTSSNAAELLVVNIATPTAPTLTSTFNLSGNGSSLALAKHGNNLFMTWSAGGANVSRVDAINVTAPASPSLISSLNIGASVALNDICIDPTGAYAFLGTNIGAAELQIISIANPASMSIAKTVDITGGNYSLNGVAYNPTLDIVVGASSADTKELVTFVKN